LRGAGFPLQSLNDPDKYSKGRKNKRVALQGGLRWRSPRKGVRCCRRLPPLFPVKGAPHPAMCSAGATREEPSSKLEEPFPKEKLA
jgi:hypothetical protein